MTKPKRDEPAVHLDAGVVARVSTQGNALRVELWEAGRWVPGPEPTGRVLWQLDTAPPAKPELLARLGIPASDTDVWLVLDLTNYDADWLRQRRPKTER